MQYSHRQLGSSQAVDACCNFTACSFNGAVSMISVSLVVIGDFFTIKIRDKMKHSAIHRTRMTFSLIRRPTTALATEIYIMQRGQNIGRHKGPAQHCTRWMPLEQIRRVISSPRLRGIIWYLGIDYWLWQLFTQVYSVHDHGGYNWNLVFTFKRYNFAPPCSLILAHCFFHKLQWLIEDMQHYFHY